MPVLSPLTAAERQFSRRPARHVVIRLQFFADCISAVRSTSSVDKRNSFNTKTAVQADPRGCFFRAKA